MTVSWLNKVITAVMIHCQLLNCNLIFDHTGLPTMELICQTQSSSQSETWTSYRRFQKKNTIHGNTCGWITNHRPHVTWRGCHVVFPPKRKIQTEKPQRVSSHTVPWCLFIESQWAKTYLLRKARLVTRIQGWGPSPLYLKHMWLREQWDRA